MIAPRTPEDERERLAALRSLGLLDTEAEERFDRITRMARRVFGTSMASFTLVDADRQWFKSRLGLDDPETPREESFCAHAILGDEPLIVEDARADERFADNPSVVDDPNVRFYAGQPISAPDGAKIGTLCVIDDQPRKAEDFDTEALRDLADMVEREIATLSLAIADELTGLANRRGFEMLGRQVLGVAERMDLDIAAIYADVDSFKPINDEFGHEEGDRALVEVARILEASLRGADVIARMGGDEFCALLTDSDAAGAATVVHRVRTALAARNAESDAPYELHLSLGISAAPAGVPRSLERLVAAADLEMFEDKRGRGAVR